MPRNAAVQRIFVVASTLRMAKFGVFDEVAARSSSAGTADVRRIPRTPAIGSLADESLVEGCSTSVQPGPGSTTMQAVGSGRLLLP